MVEPVITIGVLAAAALSAGAEALGKEAVGTVVKEAYGALKELIAAWAGNDAETLEAEANAGDDTGLREQLVARAIDKRPTDDLTKVKAGAEKLLAALKESGQGGQSVGIDIGRLEALEVDLGKVSVTGGTGFRAEEVKTKGPFRAEGIEVHPGKQ